MVLAEGVVPCRRARERVGDRDEVRRVVHGFVALLPPFHSVEDELVERKGHGIARETELLARGHTAGGVRDVAHRRSGAGGLPEPELLVHHRCNWR